MRVQSTPCIIEQKAVSESSSWKLPRSSVPVNVTKSASLRSMRGIRAISSCSSCSSSSGRRDCSDCSFSRGRACSFFLGSLLRIIIQMSYKGLTNVGATCYINSLIQTLFMTPEFRDSIYAWIYSEKIHPRREDSILYQLQKLFGRLEMGLSASTSDLIKSFQWHEDDAFLQQDIQEFNRVLFQALEKSLVLSPQPHLIKELYEGQLVHFTKCLQCHSESARQEGFQDLILGIKNIYEKIYSGCLELSLQRYIKPELLDEHNLYECSHCGLKVRAQRGVKFVRLPKLLNLVLQRFHFDYETFTRNKINDAFAFPFVLNFNRFFNGYDHIPNKINEDSSQHFLNQQEFMPKKAPVKPRVSKVPKVVSKNGTTATKPAVVGKVNTKPSANTKSFLQEMRKKKMQQQTEEQDLIFVSGTHTIHEQKDTLLKQQTTNINNNTLNHTEIPKNEKTIQIPQFSDVIPPPPPFSILSSLQPTLSVPYSAPPVDLTIEQEVAALQGTKQEQKGKLWYQQQILSNSLVQQYLRDGPLVYQLYSILVHSGTANAGHYFSYIRSSDNKRWYLFNDERVQEIGPAEIQKSFGGKGGAANAYVLYYRLYEQQSFKTENKLPQYILKAIREEEALRQQRQIERMQNLENVLVIKVYMNLAVNTIEMHKDSTFQLLFQKSVEMFNIRFVQQTSDVKPGQVLTCIKPQNLRLRLYNPVNDTKLDTYTGKQNQTLSHLGIRSYQSFLIEIKTDEQEFQEFVAGFMSIRIALWEDNPSVLSLDEKHLRLHKVSIGRTWRMKEVEAAIANKRKELLGLGDQTICVIKRHQNDQFLYHEVVNLQEYYEKDLQTVGIFQGEILFVQADSQNLNWPREFENQIHRITIKIVSSTTLQTHSLTTDSRISLAELKTTICGLVRQSSDQTIIRRGNKSGLQLKNGQASLKENRFISGTTLFLQKGIPARMGEVRIQLFLASDAAKEHYNRLHQFQFIADVPIDTNLKASEVKAIFLNILKKTKEMEVTPQQIRIRQKVNDKMGKIYRQKPMKEQQIIQKRQIAIEIVADQLDIKDFSIYVRFWDQQNWKLSQRYEFLVNKHTTMKSLSSQIFSCLSQNDPSFIIAPQQMDICRILSIHKFSIIDLVDMEYFGMISDACVLGQPLFVNSDGLLYIVKQTNIQPRELTKEQQEIFGGKIKAIVRPTRGRPPQISLPAKKEKGIVIKVVEKEIEKEDQK